MQDFAQARDVGLERVSGAGRGRISPQPIDQAVSRDGFVLVEEEDGQGRPLFRTAEREGPVAVQHLERAQNAELQESPYAGTNASTDHPRTNSGTCGSSVLR